MRSLKWISIGLVVFFSLTMFTVFVQVYTLEDVKNMGKYTVGVARDFLDEQTAKERNGENNVGGPNSLSKSGSMNLLLVNDPKVHPYIKDYFKILDDSVTGKVYTIKNYSTVQGLFGVNVNETGTYKGSYIPSSYLPLNLGSEKGKDYGSSVGGSTLTLFNYDNNMRNSLANRHVTNSGSYYTPFQVNLSNFSTKKDFEYKAPYDKGSSGNSNTFNQYRMVDQVYFAQKQIDLFFSAWPDSLKPLLKESSITPLLGMAHNSGPYNYSAYVGVGGSNPHNRVIRKGDAAVKEFANAMNSYWDYMNLDKVHDRVGFLELGLQTSNQRYLGGFLLAKQGWQFSSYASNYFTVSKKKEAHKAFNAVVGPGTVDDMVKWVKDRTGSLPSDINPSHYGFANRSLTGPGNHPYSGDAKDYKGILFKVENATYNNYSKGPAKHVRFIANETAGQNVGASLVAPYMYAKILQAMGVNVDPTNPNTYMNGASGAPSGSGSGSSGGQFIPGPFTGDVKPKGELVNVIKSKDMSFGLARQSENSLAYLFTEGAKEGQNSPNAKISTIVGKPKGWSMIGSLGEKDGFPLFSQTAYQNNGFANAYNPHKIGPRGCGIFSLTSTIHAVGFGNTAKNSTLPDIVGADKQGNNNGFVEPWEVDKYITTVLSKRLKITNWSNGPWTGSAMFQYSKAFGLNAEPEPFSDKKRVTNWLKQGYPIIKSVRPPKVDLYEYTDKASSKVKFVKSTNLTGGGHYIVVYGYVEAKDQNGQTRILTSLVDSANTQKQSSEYLVTLDSIMAARNSGVPGAVIKHPIVAFAGQTSNKPSNPNTGSGQNKDDDYYLDDSIIFDKNNTELLNKLNPSTVSPYELVGFIDQQSMSNTYVSGFDFKVEDNGRVLSYGEIPGSNERVEIDFGVVNTLKSPSFGNKKSFLLKDLFSDTQYTKYVTVRKFSYTGTTKVPIIINLDYENY